MPLVRIDMHVHLAEKRQQMSDAIHNGLVEGWEMPADDLFQIFRLHEEGDLFYSRTFPEADRTDIVFLQILAFTGYSPEVKQRGCAKVVEGLKAVGIKPDNILIALTENGDGDWYAASKED
jgi:tautomerase-like protein